MTLRLAIVGAGGHGREILDVARSADAGSGRWQLVGIAADEEPDSALLAALVTRWLGPVDQALRESACDLALVGVGDWRARRSIARRLTDSGVGSPSVVHASAQIGSDSSFADGAAVWPAAVISTHVRVGLHTHINQAASVSHDAVLDDFVTIAPHATLCGAVRVGTGGWVGAGACVLEGRTIGEGAIVGAGAVVTRDVAPWTVVAGVPARTVRGLDAAGSPA